MVGQEVGIYGVYIGINNQPCITLPSSLHILNTLGHLNFVLLLFLVFLVTETIFSILRALSKICYNSLNINVN